MIKYIVLALILLTACVKADHEQEGLHFSFDTKAGVTLNPGSTYRILMYSSDAREYTQSGTYYSILNAQGKQELVACELDDDGNIIKENEAAGLNGKSGYFYLVVASPGKECDPDGAFEFNPDNPSAFYVNAPQRMEIGKYGSIAFKNLMYEPRSTIRFEFYKKPGIADFSVVDKKLLVVGVNKQDETVKIYPALRQVQMESLNQQRSIMLTQEPPNTVNSELNNYERIYSTANANILSVASGIYAPKEDVAKYMGIAVQSELLDGDYIFMSCYLEQGNRTIELRIPLNDKNIELKPQHEYVYRVMVESDYIVVHLDIYDGTNTDDWQKEDESSSNIGTLSSSIVVGTWGANGWQSGGGLDFDIG